MLSAELPDINEMNRPTPMQQPRQKRQKEQQQVQDVDQVKPTQMTCDACHQTLPQHLFPKPKFAKSTTSTVCRQCKKNETALRCKQPPKNQIKLGRKSESGVVRRPNNFGYCNYVDQLFSLDCFPDIVGLKAFTSAKDVSESMGAIQVACQHGVFLKGE